MALLDDITAEQGRPKSKCPVAKTLTLLDGPDRDDLLTALSDRQTYQTKAIVAALRARKITLITESSVGRHRRKECACR